MDPTDSMNVGYLPNPVHNVTFAAKEEDVPAICRCTISTSSDNSETEGLRHVSPPTSDTQIFDNPFLSPINSIECIFIADSSSTDNT